MWRQHRVEFAPRQRRGTRRGDYVRRHPGTHSPQTWRADPAGMDGLLAGGKRTMINLGILLYQTLLGVTLTLLFIESRFSRKKTCLLVYGATVLLMAADRGGI